MKSAISLRAHELGFDICRFTTAVSPESAPHFHQWLAQGRHGEMGYLARNAHKRVDPCLVLPDAQSVVLLAINYASPEVGAPGQTHRTGVVARYARYQDYHDILTPRLAELSGFLDQLGGPGTESLWYVDTGPILERDLAQRAGLGFVGKHTSLISRELGNWFFLAEIITTLKLDPDLLEKNRCGTCTRCLSACPTEAIVAPFQLDARRCISYLTIELKGSIPIGLRPAIGNRIYGCDDCLAACPWNRFARQSTLMREQHRPDLAAPNLLKLLDLDEAGFKRMFTGTPMLRTKRRGLLRNVCVALGNVEGESALPALRKATQDLEPLIAEHAAWAIEQIAQRLSTAPLPPGAPATNSGTGG